MQPACVSLKGQVSLFYGHVKVSGNRVEGDGQPGGLNGWQTQNSKNHTSDLHILAHLLYSLYAVLYSFLKNQILLPTIHVVEIYLSIIPGIHFIPFIFA